MNSEIPGCNYRRGVAMKSFYMEKGLNAETYDVYHESMGPLEGDIEFYKSWARRMKGPVLEIGCGTGRILLEIAKTGIKIVGLDLSKAMLRILDSKRLSLPVEIRNLVSLVNADMTEFNLRREFPLIIIPFRAWQVILTPENQRRSLLAIRQHLTDEGRLIIDIFDPRLDFCLPGKRDMSSLDRKIKHPKSGNDILTRIPEHFNDTLNQVINEKWEFTELDAKGNVLRVEEEDLKIRWTYRWEMRHLFELTGFKVENEYSDFKGSPPDYGKEQLWVVRKS